MGTARTGLWIAVVIILSVVLVSGPLVATVELPPEDTDKCGITSDASGSVDVEVQRLPTDTFAIAKQDHGSDMYDFEADPLVLDVSNVSGCPVVSYELRFPELGIYGFKNHYPTEEEEGTVRMTVVEASFEPDRIENDTYDAQLTITVRADQNRTVHRENLTVPVEE